MREEAPDTQGEEGREASVRSQKGPAQLVSDAVSSEVLGQNGWLGLRAWAEPAFCEHWEGNGSLINCDDDDKVSSWPCARWEV